MVPRRLRAVERALALGTVEAAERCGSLDHEDATLSVAIERIHSIEQAGPLDQPWSKVAVHVEHEDEVLLFEIASNGRMVPYSCTENGLAAEIDNVSPALVVRLSKDVSKSFRRQVPQNSDFSLSIRLCDF